jgi:outer membrane biosynthesis protein TonB
MVVSKNLSTARIVIAAITFTVALNLAGCKAAPPTDDAALTAALQARIAADGAISAEPIQSSVQKQIATLNGNVSSEAARSLAAADAAQVAGIKTVINNLTVQPPAPVVVAEATPPPTLPPPPAAPAPVAPKPKTPTPPKLKPAPIVRQTPPPPPDNPAPDQTAPPPPPQPVAQAPLPPPPPPPPAFRNITLTPGTTIPIRITQTLDSATTQQGETFTGTIASDIVSDGVVAIRTGASVTGRVVAVQEAAHYKGSSLLTIELTSINRHGEHLTINTDSYSVQGKGRGGNTAAKVGGGAAVGAILGGIIGGGKGAAIGAAAGGGAGAGVNTVTRGEQVQIPSETLIRFSLTNTLALKVPTSGEPEGPAANPTLQQHPQNQPQPQ